MKSFNTNFHISPERRAAVQQSLPTKNPQRNRRHIYTTKLTVPSAHHRPFANRSLLSVSAHKAVASKCSRCQSDVGSSRIKLPQAVLQQPLLCWCPAPCIIPMYLLKPKLSAPRLFHSCRSRPSNRHGWVLNSPATRNQSRQPIAHICFPFCTNKYSRLHGR